LDFEVRLYRSGAEEHIVPLLQLAFDGWKSFDFWRWKYQDNPLKMNLIGVALSGDRIIGVSGSIYKRIKIGNRVSLCNYGTDMAVHPDYRRRGVSKQIIDYLYRNLETPRNIFGYWATEVPFLIERHKGLHPLFPYFMLYYSRIRDMGLHNRINPTKTLSARMRRLGLQAIKFVNDLSTNYGSKPLNEDIRASEISEFDDRADSFWNEVKDHYDFIVERTREHLNWNYCDPRGGNFIVMLAEEEERMLGYIVLRMDEGGVYPRGEIIDLLTVPGRQDVVGTLVAEANKFFDDNNINVVTSQVVEGHPYEIIFRRYGFLKVRRKSHLFYSLNGMDEDFKRRTRETIEATDAGRIHLSKGDFL
jgi:GNAT superfamily N-acetyltransferase